MKRLICRLLVLLMIPLAALGEEALPVREYDFDHPSYRTYDSETLKYKIETFRVRGVRCYLTKIWVRDPARQIRKATAEWRKNIRYPADMAKQIPGAALVINGSGYWNKKYPDVPSHYPGAVSDYYNTPWGSLTVTDGEVFREIPEIPYTGLTLEADGLKMYTGEETAAVLAANPLQTWSFREYCPMQQNGKDLLPEDWSFAKKLAVRTVIGRTDRNNYLILSVSNDGGSGLTLHDVNHFFFQYFEMEWLFNLDGGPSSALLARKKGTKRLARVMGGKAKDVDIMAFVELPDEE